MLLFIQFLKLLLDFSTLASLGGYKEAYDGDVSDFCLVSALYRY